MRLRVFLVALLATAALDWLPRVLPRLGNGVGWAVLAGHAIIAAIAAWRLTMAHRPIAAALLGWAAVMIPVLVVTAFFVLSGRAAAVRLGPAIVLTNLVTAALAGMLGVLAGLVVAHLQLRRGARSPRVASA